MNEFESLKRELLALNERVVNLSNIQMDYNSQNSEIIAGMNNASAEFARSYGKFIEGIRTKFENIENRLQIIEEKIDNIQAR